MQSAARPGDAANGWAQEAASSNDAASWAALLEKVLSSEQTASLEEETEVRIRLLHLYLDELGDPLSAAVHADALLDRETADKAVVDAASALVDYRPIAARMAEKLSAAYARLGEIPSEIGMLSRELSLARPPRLDAVKRRLAEHRFVRLDDVDGALELLEPQVLRSPGDDALRTRYLEMTASSGRHARAVGTLTRSSRKAKSGAERARILTDLGLLHLKEGNRSRARDVFFQALEGAERGTAALAAAGHLLRLDTDRADPAAAAAFEVVATFDPDPERRRAAAETYLLGSQPGAGDDRTVLAWRTLLDSPRRAEALDKLWDILETRKDVPGLFQLLRASGPSRDALARLIPLLEREGMWKELAEALEQQATEVAPHEAAGVLARVGVVRAARLDDTEGAIRAFDRSLRIDPKNTTSRTALEKMMSRGGKRKEAAALLEGVYRAEGSAEGLARVLTTYVELAGSDRPPLVDLACAAVDALLRAGRPAEAHSLCARALSSAPAAWSLLERYDRGVDGKEPAQARFARYETALALASDAEDRRHILKVLAAICRKDLDDQPRAVEFSHRLLRDDPKDLDALMGLLSAYERLGNAEALFAEIEAALFLFEGEQCLAVLLRKASALSRFGEREQSADLRTRLLEQPDLPPSVVESILAATYEDDQFDVYRKALELLVQSEDAAVRMRALERLGDFQFEQRGDGPAAIESWKPAARLYVEEASEGAHGRELYERVLEVAPNDGESALELIALYVRSGDWARMPEVYGTLLRSAAGIEVAITTLIDVEAAAAGAGAVDEYISMVDETIPHLSVRDDDSHGRLIRAKARMLSADPRREHEASAAHRQVLESFGTGDDVEAYAAFIESRGSSDDRLVDHRWLFEFRATRAVDPVSVLGDWARVEEAYDDLEGAVRVQQRILERAPGDPEALEAVARLKRASGDLEGYLVALRALRDVAEPTLAAALDLRMAALLVDELGRPVDGALVIERWRCGARLSGEPLDIVRRALAPAQTRPRVVEVVLRATGDAGPEETAELLGVLADGAGGDRAIPESTRSTWCERLIELHSNDPDAALEVAIRGVRDMPDRRRLWEAVALSARQGNRAGRAAEAFRAALTSGMAPQIADSVGELVIGLLDESAADTEEIIGILELVLERVPGARWALDRATLILSARGSWQELFRLYDDAIENAAGDARVGLLNEAAVAARDLAREPERAIGFFEAILELRPSNASVQGALERLYERSGKTHERVRLLSARVELVTGVARLELLHRLAAARLDIGQVEPAAEAIETMLESGASVDDVKDLLERMLDTCAGESPAAPKAPAAGERAASLLAAHYTACGLPHDLIRVMKTVLSLSRDPTVRARSVRDLVRARLEAPDAAAAAFSSAHHALKDDLAGDPELWEAAGRALLDEASREWERRSAGPDSDAARTARETILELSAHHDLRGDPDLALSVLTDGLKLPFAIAERRDLRARIASVLADRLDQPELAARAFDELFSEDAGDAVAEASVDRFAALLASAGRTREQAELWERVGRCRGLTGGSTGAAEAWSRAASHWEAMNDPARAVAAQSEAAALGSEVALAALGRLHADAGRWLDAAQALEWLIPRVTGDRRLECTLTLADAYAKAGDVQMARSRLAELVRAEPEAWSPRARLLELYRDGKAWDLLAELLVDTARLSTRPEQRLELLREAIGIRLRLLRDAEGAASIAAVALQLDPQSTATRIELGEALDAAGRHDESLAVLRRGVSGGGDGRSKQDAALRRAIAAVLLHAGRRNEALAELEAAARRNPTEPGTLHALGRVAFDEGNLDLAEATLRGLVLVLHHGAPAGSEGPSRAEVYLDLSRIAELRGDPVTARDLAESAFDSALGSPAETARLERILEDRGRHDLLALVLEQRMRSGAGAETTALALDALITLWEGPLGRAADTAAVIARYAELVAREAEATRNVAQNVWAAHVRACATVGGDAARVDAVKRHIVELARAAEALDGDEATSLLLEMARQYESGLGQTERAAVIAEALFEKDPTRGDVWLMLRDLYGQLGTSDRLVDLAEAVLWSTRSSVVHKRLRLDLARALLEDPAKVDLAIDTLEGILEDDPLDAAARDALADALEREGRHAELVDVLAKGLGLLDPAGRRAASMRLGRALERSSRTGEAAKVYERLAEDGDASAEELRVLVARLHVLGSDHLPDCIEQLLRREEGASAVELARRLVELRAAKQDRPGLVRALSLGFSLTPRDPQFRDRLLRALEEDARWDDAIRLLERAVASEPSNRALLSRLVETHQRAADLDGALDALRRALLRYPSDADLLRQRGWLHEASGRLDDAIIDLQKAYAVDASLADDLITVLAEAAPGDGGRRSLELIDLLLALDRTSDARSAAEVLLERMPGHVGGLERLASVATVEGDSALALELYRELLPLLEEDPSAVVRVSLALAAACDDEGTRAEATDALERAYELAPTNAELRNRLTHAYEASGEVCRLADLLEAEGRRTTVPSEASALLLRAAECVLDAAPLRALELSEASRAADPQSANGAVVRARSLARLGRLDEAEATLRDLPGMPRGKAAEIVSDVHLELARLRLSRDDLLEAFDSLKRACTAHPKNDEASLLLGLVAIDLDDDHTALRALRAATSSRSLLAPESKAIALDQLARLARGAQKSPPLGS